MNYARTTCLQKGGEPSAQIGIPVVAIQYHVEQARTAARAREYH
ncbi:hypothetical protein [Haloarchaeobius sp. TZWWS8]